MAGEAPGSARPDPEASLDPEARLDPEAPLEPETPRDTILVVDDEPDILVALEDLFEDRYRVLASSRPAEALELLASHPEVLVIVSDQRMPGMTGDVFLSQARTVSDAQAILLTGYADLSAVVSALNGGGIAGYASKPWEPALLRSMVSGCIDRQRLLRDLDTERALLHGLLDHAADAISFKDEAGRYVRLNAVKAEALGTTVSEAVGHRSADFLPAPAARALEVQEAEVRRTGQPQHSVEERNWNGVKRWASVSRVPVTDTAGRVQHIAIIERDVTEERRLEERLRQADKMQALGTLAGGIAHDFNNLLTAVLGNLELIGRRLGDEPRLHKLVGNASEAARRGAVLTQRLLAFTRQRDLQTQVVDLGPVLDGMDHLLVPALGGMVRLDKHLAPDLWPVTIDPDEFGLAVLNLGINARDAMPRGGELTILARNAHLAEAEVAGLPAGDYVVVGVRDTGVGMSPEVVARIFEPFFTTKEVGKGTGLGLPMVYGLMQQSGGTVQVASQVGQGTTVELYLPRADGAPARQEPPAEVSQPRLRGPVLLVDDDPQVRAVTAGFLSDLGHAHLDVDAASDALTLMERRGDIDLLIADITMPGMTGMELAAAARRAHPGLPVLLLTGHADFSVELPGTEGLPVLRKPFSQHDLGKAIAGLLGTG